MDNKKSSPSRPQRLRQINALIMFALVLGYFAFSFVPILARWRGIGFSLLGVAIALWVFDRAILKKRG